MTGKPGTAPQPDQLRVLYALKQTPCKNASCQACKKGKGHRRGWYAYWREQGQLRSQYQGTYRPWEVIEAARRQNEGRYP